MKHKRQAGVAIIEFALVLPFLLLLTFIATEFGRAMYEYHVLTKAVRDGARYISVELQNTHINEVRNLIVYGDPDPGGDARPLAPSLTLANVADPVWDVAGTAPVINIVTVRVTGYQFQSLITSIFGLEFGTLTYPDITATMRSPLI